MTSLTSPLSVLSARKQEPGQTGKTGRNPAYTANMLRQTPINNCPVTLCVEGDSRNEDLSAADELSKINTAFAPRIPVG